MYFLFYLIFFLLIPAFCQVTHHTSACIFIGNVIKQLVYVFSCAYRVMMHLESSESTQEAAPPKTLSDAFQTSRVHHNSIYA